MNRHPPSDLPGCLPRDESGRALDPPPPFHLDVAHDLRGPLGGLGLLVALAQQQIAAGDLSAATLSLQRMGEQVRLSQEILEALLRLADGLDRPLAWQDVDLSTVAQAAAEQATLVVQHSLPGRAVPSVSVEHLGRAVCDPGLVHVIFYNLLVNALKFNVDRPLVRVVVSREADAPGLGAGLADDGVVLRVSDDGIGFDAAQAAQVFEPFARLAQAGPLPGQGLGLNIVRRAVQRLGGRAQVQSAPGQGTIVRVELGRPPSLAKAP